MTYAVWCSVDDCPFEENTEPSLERVFDVQEAHRDQFGEHHVLEFDRVVEQAVE